MLGYAEAVRYSAMPLPNVTGLDYALQLLCCTLLGHCFAQPSEAPPCPCLASHRLGLTTLCNAYATPCVRPHYQAFVKQHATELDGTSPWHR